MKKAAFILLKVLSKLPLSFLYGLSGILYFIIYYLTNYRKKVVQRNLTHAFPAKTQSELEVIEKTFFRNLADWVMETIKIPGFTADELRKRCKIADNEDYQSLRDEPKGAIILTAHLGNWEWAGQRIGLALNNPVNVVYKKLSSSVFNATMRYIRTYFGNEVSSMRQANRRILQGKKRGLVTCFLADQTPTLQDAGYWPIFMNRTAPFFNGPAKIAKKLNLPVYFGNITRIKRGYYEITIQKICSNPKNWHSNAIIKEYVRFLEHNLHEQPSNWLWSHRRWKNTGKKPKNAEG